MVGKTVIWVGTHENYFLRGTILSSAQAPQIFDDAETAQKAIDKAAKFMKKSVVKALQIVSTTDPRAAEQISRF